jgi:tetratricopeptide (TPR) repeat protein
MKCAQCRTDNAEANLFCASCGAPLGVRELPPGASADRTWNVPGRTLAAGEVFAGRYRIIEELGQGGMGRVYKAYDARTRDDIALKIIQPWFAADDTASARFRLELKQARQVAHRNVIRVFDLGEAEGTIYLSMEYVPGQTLNSVIRLAGRLDAATAVGYARQIVDGLAEAHRAGIVHRDLKPQNIMIAPDGTAKIMDFGIARSGNAPALTDRGAVVGTPAYMSPEQARGAEADARSDIFALGRILGEMVTGHLPAAPDSPARQGQQAGPVVPVDLQRIILRCTAEDPGRRFQNAAELKAALDAWTAETPEGSPRRSAKGRRRGLRGLAVVLAAAAVLIPTFWLLRRARPAERPPVPVSARRTIAVLPFEDLSPDHSLTAHCEGLADDLRTKLAAVCDVISKYSSDRIKNPAKDALEFIKGLNVEYYLEGAFRREAPVIKANIKISDAKSGFQRWTRSYEIGPDAFYEMKDLISRDSAAFLGGGGAEAQAPSREPADMKSYFFYQWGRYFEDLYIERSREVDFAEAARNYRNAVSADPRNAKGYYGLGNLHEHRFSKTSRAEDLEAMTEYYGRAFALDPQMPEAHLGLGWAFYHQRKLEDAYTKFREAYRMAPRSADVNFAVGSLFRSLGLYAQALPYYERAIQLSPLDSQPYFNEASCLWYLGDYGKAEDLLKRALAFEPGTARLHLNLARQYLSMGRLDDAEREIAAGEKLQPVSEALTRHKVWLAAARGDRGRALALIPTVELSFLYEITNAYCLLGMRPEAVRNIRLGIEKAPGSVHDEAYVYPYLTSNPLYADLQGDAEFKKILAEEKARDEEKRKKYPGF